MENTIFNQYVPNQNFEDALKSSKETMLNENILQSNNGIESISVGDIKLSFGKVCQMCGNVLTSSSDNNTTLLSNNYSLCECATDSNCFTEDMENSNKRDSGFHTLKRGESEKIQDTGQQSDPALSSASSADSGVSVELNDSTKNVSTEPNSRESLPSIVVDGCINAEEEIPKFDFLNNDPVFLGEKKSPTNSPNKHGSPEDCAKNLFNFNGFKRSEVAKLIGKNTDYSRQVGQEYLKHFEFTDISLVDAYRIFLSQFALLGETQERERILSYFSQRYVTCNPDFLDHNPDSVHTLICALTLLNTDLHGNIGLSSGRKKMTYKQFAVNLSGLMADKNDYPNDLLISLYSSIKKHPLPWGGKEQKKVSRASSMRQNTQPTVRSPTKIVNRSLSTRSPMKFKGTSVDSARAGLGRSAKLKPLSQNQGLLWRKILLDSDGKRVSIGKRGWKIYSVTLHNLELHIIKKGSTEVRITSLHHCLAEESTNDSKREHVFKLTLADSSITLYQASSEKESKKWIRDINKAAALLSAAPLCSPIGSQMVFRKALLPSAPSTLPPENQLKKIQELLKEHEIDLERTQETLKTEKSISDQRTQYYDDKISHLQSEINKYQHYIKILQIHLKANSINNDDSNLEGSHNGSMVSVTPSEPPLASPSPLNSPETFTFTEASNGNSVKNSDSVFLSPAHLVSPQHRTLTLTPTSSLPNLSPILESPSNGPFGTNNNNLGSLRRRQKREIYESSLNGKADHNINNSNHVSASQTKTVVSAPKKGELPIVSCNGLEDGSASRDHLWKHGQTPLLKSLKQTDSSVISDKTKQTFPVERFEMRVAEMDVAKSDSVTQYLKTQAESSMSITTWSFNETMHLQTSVHQPIQNMTLSRVKGRREKKGIERYSYMQAISPPEES
ncbi:uncharacterized protein LOC120334825 [Styela clava]